MDIINKHDIILNDNNKIILKPLMDKHFPLLYKWENDSEVLYWSEGDKIEQWDEESTRSLFGDISKNAKCFLIEIDSIPIGYSWLQKMNIKEIIAENKDKDVRRIDISIGEKNYWNKGYGTKIIEMLLEYAFEKENVDYVYGIVYDYNKRSCRVFEKNGFEINKVKKLPEGMKGKNELHYLITKEKYHIIVRTHCT
ncbi:MAG: GNAT family N-acetyltransferase [Treponema sp.]|jgi:RimJ/RimL family protein N-acetyltransferase|nr:GNAT family N-acetyltransferase [Treponema sp.]